MHRYLAEILEERMGYPERAFWAAAERAVAAYHERFEDELGGASRSSTSRRRRS